MKQNIGRILSIAGIAAMVIKMEPAHAQDFFRDFGTSRSSGGIGPVMTSEYTYEDLAPSGYTGTWENGEPSQQNAFPTNAAGTALGVDEKYNFAIGAVRFSLAAGFGVEFNDNITLSQDHRESDFIFRPTFNIDAAWKITERNTIRLSLGASYAKYLDHSEFDSAGVLLSPTSELSFKFVLGALEFTVRDRFSYQEDTFDIPQLSGVARYKRYENQAGIKMDWAVNQYFTITTGYDHFNLWVSDDQFSSQQRAIDTIFVTPTYQLTPTIKVGLNAAFSFIDFDTDERQDGHNFLVGPLIQWEISDVTRLFLEAGFQQLSFDGSSKFDDSFFATLTDEERAIFNGDGEDSSAFYVKFQIENHPIETFTHRLIASKTSEVGFGSNFYDLYHIEYSADWTGIDKTEIGPTLFYEYYETSGIRPERAWRAGAAIGVRHNFTDSITVGLDYRFVLKNSNFDGADYYQNLVFLSAYYKF